MAQNLKDFLKHFDLTVWVIRCRPKYSKKFFNFRTLVVLATFQLINLGSKLIDRGVCKITEAVLGKAKIGEKAEFTRSK